MGGCAGKPKTPDDNGAATSNKDQKVAAEKVQESVEAPASSFEAAAHAAASQVNNNAQAAAAAAAAAMAAQGASFNGGGGDGEGGMGMADMVPKTPSNAPFELRTFKYKELQRATQQFKEPDNVLGEGGFGKVYKGFLKDWEGSKEPVPVAVKRLNPNSFQGQQEWLAEILLLGKLRHPNLVKLLGYCAENGEGMLVYEFLAKGSLDYHLFPEAKEGQPVSVISAPLSWETRLRIALDAAAGLAYLHENAVIHRDFKAPNIVLDENWGAKLTDFGLAKGADTDQTHVTTRIMGTMGYLDPKYMETGQLTKKSDVYAFGVMLLELLTGKRAMDQTQQGMPPLTAWAHQYLNQRKPDIGALVDPCLLDQFTTKSAQRAAHKLAISAKHCIEEDPNLRPLMSDMVETLRPLVMAAMEQSQQRMLAQQEQEGEAAAVAAAGGDNGAATVDSMP